MGNLIDLNLSRFSFPSLDFYRILSLLRSIAFSDLYSFIPTLTINNIQFSSVAHWCSTLYDPMNCTKLMSTELVMPFNHLIWVIPFPSCFQSFPASGAFPVSQFFKSGGQSIGVLVSASVLPMNIQDWFPLEWTGWISLQSKGLSRVFSNTTVQRHQFFNAQLSL